MHEEIIGLIPAAGNGFRLGLPYPKELYPVIHDNQYKPIAQYILSYLTNAGLQHVVFVVNETKHQLIGYFGNGHRFGCDISYVVQERVQNTPAASTSPGLAHALDSAYHLTKDKTVFFGMADTIMQPENFFCDAYRQAAENDDVILIMFPTQKPEKFGMVRLGINNQVLEIVDKPHKTDLKQMWGCIIWRPDFTEYLHESVISKKMTDFALIMNHAIRDGFRFKGIPIPGGVYIDLGTYDEIMELDRRFRLK